MPTRRSKPSPVMAFTLAVVLFGFFSADTALSQTGSAITSAIAYGTYLHPYAANSLWNSRPVNPVFDTFVIPKSTYFPSIGSGAYSTGVFLASATDAPMTVVEPPCAPSDATRGRFTS